MFVEREEAIYMIRSVDRGQDRKIPPAPGTNQIAGFGSSCPLTRWEKNKLSLCLKSGLEIYGRKCAICNWFEAICS